MKPPSSPLPQDIPQTAEVATVEKDTYGQILKSSALIGGSSIVNIAIGIVRTKAMALLLGPEGFGLMGVYGSISNFAQCVASMGINSSGERQIAEAAEMVFSARRLNRKKTGKRAALADAKALD